MPDVSHGVPPSSVPSHGVIVKLRMMVRETCDPEFYVGACQQLKHTSSGDGPAVERWITSKFADGFAPQGEAEGEQCTGYLEFVFYGYHLDRAIPRVSEAIYC